MKEVAKEGSKDSQSIQKISGDGVEGVTHAKRITCFNRDNQGKCLAYVLGICSPECEARIPSIEKKVEQLRDMIRYTKSRAAQYELRKELEEALRIQEARRAGRFDDWMSCYYEDRGRGSGGGSSESDSNRSTGMKTLLKDNRTLETKPTRSQREEYQMELQRWEEENGKLPKLARSSMSHSKGDSYLEEDI